MKTIEYDYDPTSLFYSHEGETLFVASKESASLLQEESGYRMVYSM